VGCTALVYFASRPT